MTGTFKRVKPLLLTKLLDGSIARTLVLQDTSIKAVRFDHNLMLDEGLYSVSIQDKYSVGSAAKTVEDVNGVTYKYHSRDSESEKGIKYDCIPRYAENLESNKKSHFVYYSSQKLEGKRQTFSLAYCAAINATKEVLTSDYYVERYGEIIPNGKNLQVRTLLTQYLPTDELLKVMFTDNKTYDSKFKLAILCIITLYYLQKTFCFNQIELEVYDINCATIIEKISNSQMLLNDSEWEAYLTFLFLLSEGKYYSRSIEDPNRWDLKESAQKTFYYDLDFKPISYQNIAIGDSQLNLKTNLARIAEDINGILGYNNKILTMPYKATTTSVELSNIIKYYVYPSMLLSKAYNDCVKELYETLYRYDDVNKVHNFEKSISEIAIEDSLTNCLAKDIIRNLYKIYPTKFKNFICRCQQELDTPKISLSKEAIYSPAGYYRSVAPFIEGVNYSVTNKVSQFVNMGYTLCPMSLSEWLRQNNLTDAFINDNFLPYMLTNPTEINILRNSPADFFIKNRMHHILNTYRSKRGYVTALSTYEVFVEVINNIIIAAFNARDNRIELDKDLIIPVLENYKNVNKVDTAGYISREYYIADKIIKDLVDNNDILEVVRIISTDEVTVEIKANLFVLSCLKYFLPTVIKGGGVSYKKVQVLPEAYCTESYLDLYRNLAEAARQILGFFGDFVASYGSEVFLSPEDFISWNAQMNNTQVTADMFYNYEDYLVFDLKELNTRKEAIAEQNISFLNSFQDLIRYIGFNNTGIASIQDCLISAHVENKLICGLPEANAMASVVQQQSVWEPHIFKIKASIPYAEYLRLKEKGLYGADSYTVTLPDTNQKVNSW